MRGLETRRLVTTSRRVLAGRAPPGRQVVLCQPVLHVPKHQGVGVEAPSFTGA